MATASYLPNTPPEHSTLEPVAHQPWHPDSHFADPQAKYPYGDDTLNGKELVTEEGIQVVPGTHIVPDQAHSPAVAESGGKDGKARKRRLCGMPFGIAIALLAFILVGGIVGGIVGGVLGSIKPKDTWEDPAEGKWYLISSDIDNHRIALSLDPQTETRVGTRNLSHSSAPRTSSDSYHFGFKQVVLQSSEERIYYWITNRNAPADHRLTYLSRNLLGMDRLQNFSMTNETAETDPFTHWRLGTREGYEPPAARTIQSHAITGTWALAADGNIADGGDLGFLEMVSRTNDRIYWRLEEMD